MRILALQQLSVVAATAWLLGAAGGSLAQPITVPTDLNPGDRYRLAFVTSDTTDAPLQWNIENYNAFVAGVAATVPELVALGTTWKAVASTVAVSARDNTGTAPSSPDDVPIYLLDDTLLAAGNADLWDGSINVPLRVSETGGDSPYWVWTGTLPDGTAATEPFPGFVLGMRIVGHGVNTYTDSLWVSYGTMPYDWSLSLYAISEPLVVPTIPASSPWSRALLTAALFLASVSLLREARPSPKVRPQSHRVACAPPSPAVAQRRTYPPAASRSSTTDKLSYLDGQTRPER